VLKAVGFLPERHEVYWGWRTLKEMVNAKGKGELTLEWAGGPEAIPSFDQPEAVRAGVVDMYVSTTSYWEGVMPESAAHHLSRITAAEERESGFYDYMVGAFKKHNVFYLGRGREFTPFQMFTTKPIDKTSKFYGRRFRMVAMYAPFYKALGIVGVTMPMGDAYTALERGLIEGVTIPRSSYLSWKWYEIAKYKIGPSILCHNLVILINLEKWNALPKHLQDILTDTMIEAMPAIRAFNVEAFVENERKIAEVGTTTVEFSPEDAKYFTKTVYDSSWKVMGEKVGTEEVAKIRKTVEK